MSSGRVALAILGCELKLFLDLNEKERKPFHGSYFSSPFIGIWLVFRESRLSFVPSQGHYFRIYRSSSSDSLWHASKVTFSLVRFGFWLSYSYSWVTLELLLELLQSTDRKKIPPLRVHRVLRDGNYRGNTLPRGRGIHQGFWLAIKLGSWSNN